MQAKDNWLQILLKGVKPHMKVIPIRWCPIKKKNIAGVLKSISNPSAGFTRELLLLMLSICLLKKENPSLLNYLCHDNKTRNNSER